MQAGSSLITPDPRYNPPAGKGSLGAIGYVDHQQHGWQDAVAISDRCAAEHMELITPDLSQAGRGKGMHVAPFMTPAGTTIKSTARQSKGKGRVGTSIVGSSTSGHQYACTEVHAKTAATYTFLSLDQDAQSVARPSEEDATSVAASRVKYMQHYLRAQDGARKRALEQNLNVFIPPPKIGRGGGPIVGLIEFPPPLPAPPPAMAMPISTQSKLDSKHFAAPPPRRLSALAAHQKSVRKQQQLDIKRQQDEGAAAMELTPDPLLGTNALRAREASDEHLKRRERELLANRFATEHREYKP